MFSSRETTLENLVSVISLKLPTQPSCCSAPEEVCCSVLLVIPSVLYWHTADGATAVLLPDL